ncbi:MAG: glycosyltransferase family 1 protein [Candidatus Moraniibacteriota bacterium]
MIIGIDASFLRKPGTGIGAVTEQSLRVLSGLEDARQHKFILYVDEYVDKSFLPANFEKHIFLPKWTRDDVPRRIMWERMLAQKATEDGCDAFLSLSQSATVFPKRSILRHLMVVHDIVPLLFPAYRGKFTHRWHARAIARAISSAENIIAVSSTTKRDLELNLGVQDERITVAYPDCAPIFRTAIDPEISADVIRKYGLERGYIYHGGGLEIRKNTERLLEAYATLIANGRDVPPLVISGKVYVKRNRLATDVIRIIDRLKLTEHVMLLGFVPDEDLPALYQNSLLFAFPSIYEGFGIPILEAFAMGAPVLAGQNAGAVPEVTRDAALLVDPLNVASIAEGLARMIDDPELRAKLSERGTERMKDFSWTAFAQALLDGVVPKTLVAPTTVSASDDILGSGPASLPGNNGQFPLT